jgi:hypothetical protein
MNALAEKLAEEAMTLPEDDRAALVNVLLRSLKASDPKQIELLWVEEAERRVQEVEDGTVALLDGEAVLQEVRERLQR